MTCACAHRTTNFLERASFPLRHWIAFSASCTGRQLHKQTKPLLKTDSHGKEPFFLCYSACSKYSSLTAHKVYPTVPQSRDIFKRLPVTRLYQPCCFILSFVSGEEMGKTLSFENSKHGSPGNSIWRKVSGAGENTVTHHRGYLCVINTSPCSVQTLLLCTGTMIHSVLFWAQQFWDTPIKPDSQQLKIYGSAAPPCYE